MKKIVSLVIACMLLLSCFAINAFAADPEVFTFTASAPNEDGIFGLTLNTAASLKTGKFALSFDSSKVQLVNVDGTVPVTAKSNAFTATVLAANLAPTASGIFYDADNYDLAYTFAMDDATGDVLTGDLVTIYFKKVGNIAETDAPIWVLDSTSPNYARTGSGWKVELTFNGGFGFNQYGSSVTYRKAAGTGVEAFGFTNIVDAAVEPEFGYKVEGTTVECYGKVSADAENYGVVFTAESTVNGARAQKYYGAMPGDTVGDYNGATTFNFNGWDGSFEIVLKGVHAGDKAFDFFVNDTVIKDTHFTFTVAEPVVE